MELLRKTSMICLIGLRSIYTKQTHMASGTKFQQERRNLRQAQKLALIIFLIVLGSCNKSTQSNEDASLEKLQGLNDSIRKTFAPDKRVAVYDISISRQGNTAILKGETSLPEALNFLKTELDKKTYDLTDQVVILPDNSIGETPYAVVNNSVANIRSKPKHSSELATQAVLGIPLKVLKIEGDFYLIQTPDKYISWVDHGGVRLMTEVEYATWNKSEKVIYLKPFGSVYKNPANELDVISDITLGSILKRLGETENYFVVEYPDMRRGYLLKSESERYENWVNELKPSQESIELYARSLIGMPYLWGGTSSKGMDCSGFTKTVYRMNGFVIPRDASQQIFAGKVVDPDLGFKNLEKGDLMFFGKKQTDSTSQKVTHVGIWLGNDSGEFIHASGRVRISSINEDSQNYDAFNKGRYLGSRRYLGIEDPLLTHLTSSIKLTP